MSVFRAVRSRPEAVTVGGDPGLDRHWARGQVLLCGEAWEVMAKLHPERAVPHDPALMACVLAEYVQRGLIAESPERPGAYVRPAEDLRPLRPQSVAEVEPNGFVAFGEVRSRVVHVRTTEGEIVPLRVPYPVPAFDGPRDGYEAHLAGALAASKQNPLPAEMK